MYTLSILFLAYKLDLTPNAFIDIASSHYQLKTLTELQLTNDE